MSTSPEDNKFTTRLAWARLPDCDKLALLEAALHELLSGAMRSQVRHGDYWVTYQPVSVNFLKQEVARLRAICGNRTGITIARTPIGLMPQSVSRRS